MRFHQFPSYFRRGEREGADVASKGLGRDCLRHLVGNKERVHQAAREIDMKRLIYFIFVGLILSSCSTVKIEEKRKSFEPCGISLKSISKVAGYPGDIIELFGQWGDSQGEKLPLINKGKPHDLEVISWSNSIIKAKIPQDLDTGVYRVGVYCNDLSKGGTYGTVFNEFEIFAQEAVEESTPQIPMHPTPQNAPCADQPKSFGELVDAFNAGQSPSPSQVNGVWVAIGFVDDASSSV